MDRRDWDCGQLFCFDFWDTEAGGPDSDDREKMVEDMRRSMLLDDFRTVVRFYNSKGKLVLPADPFAGIITSRGTPFRIVSIPIGTYTVIISAGGRLPVILKNIKVEKGVKKVHDVDLEYAGEIEVNLENLEYEDAMDISYRFEDSKGNELKEYGPLGESVVTYYRNEGTKARIYNLSKAVGRVWIKIPGFKAFYVKNTSTPGSTTKVTKKCIPLDE